ncbi:hypothetical protein NEOKW01_1367 [Nematocida sp. AWRm80]|nr:hypothetical protein NEOKW01_1367 [Nematocida sp. AWRm80]
MKNEIIPIINLNTNTKEINALIMSVADNWPHVQIQDKNKETIENLFKSRLRTLDISQYIIKTDYEMDKEFKEWIVQNWDSIVCTLTTDYLIMFSKIDTYTTDAEKKKHIISAIEERLNIRLTDISKAYYAIKSQNTPEGMFLLRESSEYMRRPTLDLKERINLAVKSLIANYTWYYTSNEQESILNKLTENSKMSVEQLYKKNKNKENWNIVVNECISSFHKKHSNLKDKLNIDNIMADPNIQLLIGIATNIETIIDIEVNYYKSTIKTDISEIYQRFWNTLINSNDTMRNHLKKFQRNYIHYSQQLESQYQAFLKNYSSLSKTSEEHIDLKYTLLHKKIGNYLRAKYTQENALSSFIRKTTGLSPKLVLNIVLMLGVVLLVGGACGAEFYFTHGVQAAQIIH